MVIQLAEDFLNADNVGCTIKAIVGASTLSLSQEGG